ncbi:MAG: LLM class flavin-dependent oxidoreductase [Chloroflexi bacterium]|jgi:alkanesulfonate monooxygenase SsuD/methylene tetrahydromethanopterin reductase-like flavin-dependent oxidoreductase (luciferase family)|nr:LLM class flavin-dependent oxidoreductase [Chloroflexota bacterium]
MRFAHFSHVWSKPGMTPAQRYQQLWRELAACDELGFDYGFCVEHHFSPHESWMPSPSIYCAAAATYTRRLRIGPMGYIVPLYDPLRIVEDAAVLDNVLDGRLELGLISGISPHYFRHYQGDFAHRRERVNEALALVKTAFASEGPFSFSGPFHRYERVSLAVRPLQRPHPPLWVQSRDPETLALLAREGVSTGYLFLVPRAEAAPRYRDYLQAWRAAGHAQPPHIAYWSLVYVDETDELALARAAPHIVHTFTQVFGFGDVGGIAIDELADNLERRGERGAAEIARHLADVDYLLRRNLVFVGAPETVARRIQAAATEGLFDTLCAEFNIGFLDEESLMRSLHLFGQRVVPALRAFTPY